MTVAPIALFVYNRPAHTRRTVEALKRNDLAGDSDLIIFSDAPQSVVQADAVREVREYVRQVTGFKLVTIVERETNFGLSRSIIEGVGRVCAKYGRVIVMEDDLITSPHFLRFMNDALEFYKNEDRVMHISGSIYPIEAMQDETFFFRVPLCWGWATWDRAWRHFHKSDDVMNKFDQKMRDDFSFNDTYHFWKQLEDNRKGLINTWFVYWYAALFLRSGLALFPGSTLVKNIGFDGTGVHCGSSGYGKDVEPASMPIRIESIPLNESKEAAVRHKLFFRKDYQPSPSNHARFFRVASRAIEILTHAIRRIRPIK